MDLKQLKPVFKNDFVYRPAYTQHRLLSCVTVDGKISLKRIDLVEDGQQIITHMGWLDELGPHESLSLALSESNDFSKIDFRVENKINPKNSIYLKGWDGYLTLSFFDWASGDPLQNTHNTVYVGKLSVQENGAAWKIVQQKIVFDKGYLKLKYNFQYGHVLYNYDGLEAEVLDTAFAPQVQKLNVANDFKVSRIRHGSDRYFIETSMAIYELGYQGGHNIALKIQNKKEGSSRLLELPCDVVVKCGSEYKYPDEE